jgi:antitoxin HicB
LRHAFT